MKWRKVPDKKYTPFEVVIPKDITGTKRERKYFPSQEDAEGYIVRIKLNGFRNADTRTPEDPTALTIKDCTAQWRGRHRHTGKAAQNQINMVMDALNRAHGKMPIVSFTHRDAEAWIASLPGGFTHKHNHYRVANRFFAWAHDWLEAIPRNPFKKAAKPKGERNPVTVLSPDRFTEYLKAAMRLDEKERWPLLWWLCLGGFEGFRPCEAAKFNPSIDIRENEVFVRNPKKTKKGLRPRWVEITPPMRRALEILPIIDGKVIPWNDKNFRLHRDNIKGNKPWPQNCLRHSFRTYYVVKYQDLEKARVQLGHETDEMTTYQYGTSEERQVAETWMAIDVPALYRKVLAE